jgi:hypothetical protein
MSASGQERDMSNDATRYIQAQARQFAAKRLQRAAQYMALHAKPSEKGTGRANAEELIRWEWPGVLSVFDADTGVLLARSEPGQPDALAKDFKPSLHLSSDEA